VSLAVDHRKHETDVIRFIATILEERKLTRLLLEEDDWSDLVAILDKCAQRSEVREVPTTDPSSDIGLTTDPALLDNAD